MHASMMCHSTEAFLQQRSVQQTRSRLSPCRAARDALTWCAGAKVLAGGTREGPVMEATLLEEVPSDCNVMTNEVFGPVLVLERYAVFRDAINRCLNTPVVFLRWVETS